MKKHVLMMVAVCLLALPAMANDLAEQLCADEIFVSMVKETNEVVKHVHSLNDSQREAYLRSDEFACFGERFASHREYLSITFNLFERADREIVITNAIKKITKQQDPQYCEFYYGLLIQSCYNIPGGWNPQWQAECFTNAQAWYTNCMSGGSGPVD